MKKPLLGALAALALLAVPAAVLAQSGKHGAHGSPAPATPAGHTAHAPVAPAPKAPAAKQPVAAKVDAHGVRTVELLVTSAGFEPADVAVKAGKPVKLVITRKAASTCATEIVMDALGIHQPLPLDTPVTVEFTPSESGKLRYACAMDHVSGVITVQ